jgi:putative ABC transport system permease protein
MIKNYWLVAIRNFLRQRVYSWLNIIGLTVGLASTLLILLWVYDELSVDQFHKDLDKIYKVYSNNVSEQGEIITWNDTPGPLADYIRDQVPGVTLTARTMSMGAQLLQVGENSFLETGRYADPEFFELFNFPLIHGSISKNREDRTSLLISEKVSQKFFGNEIALGKFVKVGSYDMVVTGVFQDIPENSSIKFEFVCPMQLYKDVRGDGYNWGNFDLRLFLKLTDGSQVPIVTSTINKKFEEIAKAENETDNIDFYLQPFSETYLQADFEKGRPAKGKIVYVRIFTMIAIFILIMACVNFMNMATAHAMNRSKEIGIRKVVGAARTSLVFQFLGEAILTTFIAMGFAITLVFLMLPGFNMLIEKNIQFSIFDPHLILTGLGLLVITAIMAGGYPAFFLSSFNPASVLKGSTAGGNQGNRLRKSLVVFQFSLTVVLIICALGIFNQLKYMLEKDLGFDRHAVLSIDSEAIDNRFESFSIETSNHPGIIGISRSNESLVRVSNQSSSVVWQGKTSNNQQLFRVILTDYDFLETMKLTLQVGRSFSKEFNDVGNFIISKSCADAMGMADPIGQKLSVWQHEGIIVGVIDDFHSNSLKKAIDPAVLFCKPEWTNRIFIRFDPQQLKEVLITLEQTTKKLNPNYPFSYQFMDDDFEEQYKTEKVAGSLAGIFTALAIIISGLGLLGLTAYSAEHRRKEISIRKTLGASVTGLVTKFSAEFLQISVVAFIIGAPIAYWSMNKFLNNYAYHTDVSWQIFLITGLVTMSITALIVVYQVRKVAMINPVEVLRNE